MKHFNNTGMNKVSVMSSIIEKRVMDRLIPGDVRHVYINYKILCPMKK